MSLFSTSSQSFMVMITAPPDMPAYSAYLAFSASLSAQPFWGSTASEYMSSHAGITFSVPGRGGSSLTTPAWLPQGSTPAFCYSCPVSIPYNVPVLITISAYAYSHYEYSYNPNVGIAPVLAGLTIHTHVDLFDSGPRLVGPPDTQLVILSTEAVPEPATFSLVIGAFLCNLIYRQTRPSRRHSS
jgi:hypothetical protein